jgi:hypothetical protein
MRFEAREVVFNCVCVFFYWSYSPHDKVSTRLSSTFAIAILFEVRQRRARFEAALCAHIRSMVCV